MSVIVLLADGARTDMVARGIRSGELPALARLAADGASVEVTSVFPSVTGPAYAPFLMGRFPGPVGLPGLRWYDRARSVCTFPDYTRSYVGYQMRALDRDLDSASPTIFELVPGSIGALSVITRGLPRARQLASLTPASAFRAARTHFRGDLAGWLQVDRDVAKRLLEVVQRDRPAYAFAAFTGVDKTSHAAGHESARAAEALRIVDDTVAALRSQLEAAGQWEQTQLWVTSDHGHSPVTRHEDLARVVEQFGYRVMAHPFVYRWRPDVAVMVSGNAMSHLYVDLDRRTRPFLDGMSDRGRALVAQLEERESVDLVLLPLSADACEVRARGRGSARVVMNEGRFAYVPERGDPLGLGGPLSGLDADAAHEATLATDYPDSLVQIARLTASPRAGDIILSAARNWDFRARYEPIPHVSAHGALHREHMLVPLILNRPPARQPRRTTDLMPSALRALGRDIPAGLDGRSFL